MNQVKAWRLATLISQLKVFIKNEEVLIKHAIL